MLHDRMNVLPSTYRRAIAATTCMSAVLLVTSVLHAVAAEPPNPCDCYALTAWTTDSGLPPGSVSAMAQDPAGYLWLGTSEGLIRFDGHQFTAWAETGGPSLPGTAISALIAARDGSLWVGFSDARGVARLQGGELNVHAGEMLPRRPVTLLLEDSSGAIWAGGTDGMSVLENGRWRTVGANEGLVDSEVSGLYEDRKGGLWVGTSVGVFHRPVATAAFFLHTAASKFVQSFAEDAAGHIWMTDMERMLRRLDGGVEPEFADDVPLPGGGWRLFTDARGNLWVSALGNGLFRIDHRSLLSRPRVERLKYEHKFAGSGPGGARAIFHDRDHNIWVSTRASGLLRIRESFVNSNVPLPGLTFDGVRALTATPDGNVWIATFFNLLRTDREGMQEYDFARTMALHASHDGELWAATGSGIGRVNEGRLIAEPVPATLRLERISSLALAPDRALWICSVEQGVFRWASGRLEHFSKEPLAAQPCGVVHAGRDGRIWIGFTRGGLAIYANGEFRQVTPSDGLAPGGVAVMYEDSRRRLWIATANGVSRVDGDRFVTVTDKNGLPRRIVPSFVEDQQGYIWLGVQAGSGVIRFHPDDFDAAAAAPGGQLRYTLYDETDGLIGPLFRSSRPSAVRGGDGRIWLASGNSIATLDPARVPGESPAPLPTIERVVIDGRDVPPTSNLVLPPHTATVRVHYSALDLTRASKLRFRYRLEGFDQGWIDAGQSREAQYANLRPGDYRLRIATTGDGAWHADETVWAFSVQPPFYEARWFIASCVFAFLLLISAVWWARVRMIRKEFALVVGERARVSRDLHDTLLQSLAAVGMELEVLASHADAGAGHPLSSSLRALRRQVGRCVVEARRSTSELRSPRLEVRDLVDDLRQFADDVSLGTAVQVDVVVSGRSRRSTPETDEQLLKIGQEAIANAVRHSGSDLVRVELVYTRRTVMLRVSDTGSGFEVDAARSGEHWGIRNMHDRATRISAQFTVTSAPGQGTTVETIVVR